MMFQTDFGSKELKSVYLHPVAVAALCSSECVIQPPYALDFFCLELLKNTIPSATGSLQEIEV